MCTCVYHTRLASGVAVCDCFRINWMSSESSERNIDFDPELSTYGRRWWIGLPHQITDHKHGTYTDGKLIWATNGCVCVCLSILIPLGNGPCSAPMRAPLQQQCNHAAHDCASHILFLLLRASRTQEVMHSERRSTVQRFVFLHHSFAFPWHPICARGQRKYTLVIKAISISSSKKMRPHVRRGYAPAHVWTHFQMSFWPRGPAGWMILLSRNTTTFPLIGVHTNQMLEPVSEWVRQVVNLPSADTLTRCASCFISHARVVLAPAETASQPDQQRRRRRRRCLRC